MGMHQFRVEAASPRLMPNVQLLGQDQLFDGHASPHLLSLDLPLEFSDRLTPSAAPVVLQGACATALASDGDMVAEVGSRLPTLD